MNSNLLKISLLAVFTLGLSACTTFGTMAEDSSIESSADDLLETLEKENQPAYIGTVSHNLYLLIFGQVPNEQVKAQASNAVKGIPEIRKIFNELRITDPETVSGFSDSWITTKVKSSLAAEKGLDSKRIKVITENSEVFLLGLVTRSEGEKAALVARNISGVERVVKIFEYID